MAKIIVIITKNEFEGISLLQMRGNIAFYRSAMDPTLPLSPYGRSFIVPSCPFIPLFIRYTF
jgi:hypothetical protein